VTNTTKTYAGRYRLEEEVGRGGMAVVYRGIDERMKRTVAVKVLYPYLAIKPENKVRFQREAEVVANLDHPNVVRIYDYSGIDSDENFIVTEFIEGDTLKRFAADHPLFVTEVGAMMVREIAAALEHAHGRGITHRDVKPENVMINQRGVLKLMDFGIAQIKDVQQMTVTGQMIGSPAHMSPEHIEGRQLDHRADIFSLGTVLYLLCAGKLPFKGNTAHALLKRILDADYVPAQQVNPAVGSELSGIIDRCLRREPTERYQSCTELRLDLEHCLGQYGFDNIPRELATFFADPEEYQQQARNRIIEVQLRKARMLARSRKLALALRHYDRALCLDPTRDDVVEEIERVRRRGELVRTLVNVVAPMAAVAIVVVCGWFLLRSDLFGSSDPADVTEVPRRAVAVAAPDAAPLDVVAEGSDLTTADADAVRLAEGDVGAVTVPPVPQPDARVLAEGIRFLQTVEGVTRTARATVRVAPDRLLRVRDWNAARLAAESTGPAEGGRNGATDGGGKEDPGGKEPVRVAGDGGTGGGTKVPPAQVRRPVTIFAVPPAAEVWVDGTRQGFGRVELELLTGSHELRLHHPSCAACRDTVRAFDVKADGKPLVLRERIGIKPAQIQVVSPHDGAVFVETELVGRVNRIVDLPARNDDPWEVNVKVLFDDDALPTFQERVLVTPGKLRKVRAKVAAP
jgi:predicted Ser/Thr protein kinase